MKTARFITMITLAASIGVTAALSIAHLVLSCLELRRKG